MILLVSAVVRVLYRNGNIVSQPPHDVPSAKKELKKRNAIELTCPNP